MTAATLLAVLAPDSEPGGRPRHRMPCEDDPDKWFAEEGSFALSEAKAGCRSCRARIPCLEFAVVTGERFGVWGGQSASDRGWGPGGRTVAAPRKAD